MPLLQSLGRAASNLGSRLGLPEYGISERLGYNPRTVAPQASSGPLPQVQGASSAFVGPIYNGPQQSTNSYRPPTSQGVSTSQGQINNVNADERDQQSLIDMEFESALGELGSQESGLRSGADIAKTQLGQGEEKTKSQITTENQRNLQGLSEEETSAQNQTNVGMREARDLFRQTEQRNIANLSGLGISSSSVTEAMAEKLGVETMRRLGGLTGSLQEFKMNVAKERVRVNQIFEDKVTQLREYTQSKIDEITLGLQNGLSTIAGLKGKAAVAKAQERASIASQARQQILSIQMEAQNRERALSDAAARRAQALEEAKNTMFKPTDFGGIQNAVNNIQGIQAAGFNTQPVLNYQNVGGQQFVDVQGKFLPQKPLSAEDELLQNLYSQAGIAG